MLWLRKRPTLRPQDHDPRNTGTGVQNATCNMLHSAIQRLIPESQWTRAEWFRRCESRAALVAFSIVNGTTRYIGGHRLQTTGLEGYTEG